MNIKNIIVLIGPQGSGKGTQAHLLAEKYGWDLIIACDCVRQEALKQTDEGGRIRELSMRGELIPDSISFSLIKKRLANVPASCTGVVLDGFPRSIEQAQLLESIVAVTKVVHITLSDDLVLKRVSGRLLCPQGHVFNKYFVKPKKEGVCDYDGLPLHTREDDREEAIRKRLHIYKDITSHLIEYYQAKGLLLTIDGDAAIPEVHQVIVQSLGSYAR